MNYFSYYTSQMGILRIVESDEKITQIMLRERGPELDSTYEEKDTPLIQKVMCQLDEYFIGQRKTFDFPIEPKGTEFQRRVWKALIEIPYGELATYKQIGEAIDCAKGARAVGLSNNRNPIIIVIPCHRVIGSNGKLVGYAGGLHLKKLLLEVENII